MKEKIYQTCKRNELNRPRGVSVLKQESTMSFGILLTHPQQFLSFLPLWILTTRPVILCPRLSAHSLHARQKVGTVPNRIHDCFVHVLSFLSKASSHFEEEKQGLPWTDVLMVFDKTRDWGPGGKHRKWNHLPRLQWHCLLAKQPSRQPVNRLMDEGHFGPELKPKKE